jgi:hypothetical protein
MNELEYICLRIPTTRNLDLVGYLPIALLETGVAARVYPENRSLGVLVSNLVGVFDCKLRLSAGKSANDVRISPFSLTLLRLGRRGLS